MRLAIDAMPGSGAADQAGPARPVPSRTDLFLTYFRIGLIGFGGVNAWARRVIVEERRWLSEQEYAETLGLGQVLPGPNALNVAIIIGQRFHGGAGSVLAAIGLFAGPLSLLAGLASLYDAYGQVPVVRGILAGTAAAAAGMVLGTAAKMATKLKPTLPLALVGLASLVAAGFFRLSLPVVVLGLAPFGIWAAWLGSRRK
jgi:chromate transporter